MNKLSHAMNAMSAMKSPREDALRTERSLIETVGITSDHLERIERRIETLYGGLFGNEPADDCRSAGCEGILPVSKLADRSFNTAVRIENRLDEIISRVSGS